jgi:hypothetical protein
MLRQKKFVMGPLQRELVRALKSGDFEQAKGKLFRSPFETGNDGVVGHCCLGVAMCVLKANFPRKIRLPVDQDTAYCGMRSSAISMPGGAWQLLGLRDQDGEFSKTVRVKNKNCSSMFDLNDRAGLTLKQIGRFIETHAAIVFVEPK